MLAEAGLVVTVTTAAGGIVWQFVIRPIKEDAEVAKQRSRRNREKLQRLDEKLLGDPEDETDDGVLVELSKGINEIKEETKRHGRRQREGNYRMRKVAEAINQSDVIDAKVPIPTEDDFLRGPTENDDETQDDD